MSARLLAGILVCGVLASRRRDLAKPTVAALSAGFLETEARCTGSGWEKIAGVVPDSVAWQTVLFSAINSHGITRSCFERCERANCTAFVVDHGRSVCYAVRTEDEELTPEANATFYQRICLSVPDTCARDRLWQVERTPGAVFIDPGGSPLPEPIRRSQCYEKCTQSGARCRSAQFRTTKPLTTGDAFGRCTLSAHERESRPRAYRASMYRDEYLRHQCGSFPSREYCSYAEFPNATLPYSDHAVSNLDESQCQSRCDRNADGFVCRGYTLDNSSGSPVCLLHSEDTSSLGIGSLLVAANAVYREREPCLDLKVRCNQTTMIVELKTGDGFYGRMYANGYAESCGVQGVGADRTVLALPVPALDTVRAGKLPCGLTPAYPIGDRDRRRPLVWATIVVQFNPIVQRLGDQAVRVGCNLNDREPPRPRNITVQSTLSFLDPNAGVPPISSTIVNASTRAPSVTMRILDENSRDAIVTHLGQKLALHIRLTPPDGPYDIAAGHLVASSASGAASYLLLNEVGCPTDPATFPALAKDPRDGRSLIANFTAFKFPDSQLVRFNVVVRFCSEECAPTSCSDDRLSYGRKRKRRSRRRRRRREASESRDEQTPEELPLQLSIIVQNPVASTADRLSSRETVSPDTLLVTGNHSLDRMFCMDVSLALSLLIFWLILQIALVAGCLLTVARYKRTAVRAEEDRANVLARHLYGVHGGGHFEIARRVRWADRNPSTSSLD